MTTKELVIFACGAAVGVLGHHLWANRKKAKLITIVPKEPDEEPEDTEDEPRVYHEVKTAMYNYSGYSVEPEDTEHPYQITPDEFGEFEDYSKQNLVWYSDGALCDEQDILIDDAASIVGEEFMDHFGDYEPDIVYIRNDRLSSDFEIRKDPDSYINLVGKRPYLAEDYADD